VRPDIGGEIRRVVAELGGEHRGLVLRLLRVSLGDESIVGVERSLGWSRQRLGRAEQGGRLNDDELAELVAYYGACVADVRRAKALARRGKEGAS